MTVMPNLRSRVPASSPVENEHAAEDQLRHENSVDTPQVLFMDTHDVGNRTGHAPPSYYQVATPKSPHELSLMDEVDGHSGPDMGGTTHRESEESERLKYETAKKEILDSLNLHILLNNNECNDIDSELGRVEAQMKVLEHMHQDKDLLKKISQHQEELYTRHRESFLRKREMEASQFSSLSFNQSINDPISSNSGNGSYFYHTRSKSTNNLNNANPSRLRPANSNTIGSRLTGGKSLSTLEAPLAASSSGSDVEPLRPSLLNQHHRRNYSSTCLTSNSGVVGANEKNEPIFKRPDGILVIIACSYCDRSGFTSAQGIVNHVRLKHSKTYSSQPLAVLNNQHVLPNDLQPPEVVQQFKELNLDPGRDYLPHIINMQTGNVAGKAADRKNSLKELSPRAKSPAGDVHSEAGMKSTKHLKKLYKNDDFKELVDYVNDAQKDLDSILKQPSESEANDESDDAEPKEARQVRSSSRSSASSHSAIQSDPNTSHERKRSSASDADAKKRHKPAEKKVRPDAIALMNIPERDKRSSHYNLRAKSKLRGHSRYE